MIRLENISEDNFYKCINSKFAEYCAPNMYSLAQAYLYPVAKPFCLFNDDEYVGFVMYLRDSDDNEVWIWRFNIDEKFQGKGYGRKGMEEVLKRIIDEYDDLDKIYLSTEPENEKAIKLYESLGFINTGKVEEGEVVFIKKI